VNAAGPGEAGEATGDIPPVPPSTKPVWTKSSMTLSYGKGFSAKFRSGARLQADLFDEFERQNWPIDGIMNPFVNDDAKFADAIKYLKRRSGKAAWPIEFYRDNSKVNWRSRSG
jgi:hypothetical protein